MRTLVLGGTVFLSEAVARRALERGHDVTCVARGTGAAAPEGAQFVRLDRDAPDALSALRDETFDAVIDVARHPSRVRSALTALSARAAHWTFVSSISVYADHATPGLNAENGKLLSALAADADEFDPENYGPAKVACEQAVADARGDDAFIVRAGLIAGPGERGDRFRYWALRMARGGEVLAPSPADDWVQIVDVRDLADWIVRSAETRLTGAYDAVGPAVPRGEFLQEVARGAEHQPALVWVPPQFLEEHGVQPWSGPRSLPLWLPGPDRAGMLCHDPGPAIEAGLEPREIAATARDTVVEWTARGADRELTSGLSADVEAELLRAWAAGR